MPRVKNATDDDFLTHVFPGSSPASARFRAEVQHLNLYCNRYKGSVRCVLITGPSGAGKNFTTRAISAHSQWLTLTDDERHDLYYDKSGHIFLPSGSLVESLLFKEHLPKRGAALKRMPRLATVLGPALADDLAASELFGHRKGAFTGADSDHPGVFGEKTTDDVLLDEIGDLTLRTQAKLLQFLETHTFRPMGGLAAHEDVSAHRVFLATNRPLERLVETGHFREDLFRRIAGFRISIPPLRERRDTIRELAHSMLRSINQRHRGDEQIGPSLPGDDDLYCRLPESQWETTQPLRSNWVIQLTEADLSWCESYDWPGNVRELRQRLESYVFHNGHVRLGNVLPPQRFFEQGGDRASCSPNVEQLIEAAVNLHLRRVLTGESPSPGQPKGLTEFFGRLVKDSVYRFKRDHRLTRDQMTQLFPAAVDAESTIGRWRAELDPPDTI